MIATVSVCKGDSLHGQRVNRYGLEIPWCVTAYTETQLPYSCPCLQLVLLLEILFNHACTNHKRIKREYSNIHREHTRQKEDMTSASTALIQQLTRQLTWPYKVRKRYLNQPDKGTSLYYNRKGKSHHRCMYTDLGNYRLHALWTSWCPQNYVVTSLF
jgi:hypothetical protein